jgi:hypothetical protein
MIMIYFLIKKYVISLFEQRRLSRMIAWKHLTTPSAGVTTSYEL